MYSNNKIPFGLNAHGRMVIVSAVPRGLKCGCVCPACHGALVANQGDIRAHYFSHRDARDCQSGFETAIHRMAKQLIFEQAGLSVPGLMVTEQAADESGKVHTEQERVADDRWLGFDSVEIEKGLDQWRADAIGYVGDTLYCLEVRVTHGTTEPKRRGYREKQVFAIEIEVRDVDLDYDPYQRLKNIVIDETRNKDWLSYPSEAGVRDQVRERLNDRIRAANEKLREARRARDSQKESVQAPRGVARKPAIPAPRPVKHYPQRFMFCTHCRHLWAVPAADVPPAPDILACPECGGVVSSRNALDDVRKRFGRQSY